MLTHLHYPPRSILNQLPDTRNVGATRGVGQQEVLGNAAYFLSLRLHG